MEGITPVNLLEEERKVVVCALLPTREGVRGDLQFFQLLSGAHWIPLGLHWLSQLCLATT